MKTYLPAFALFLSLLSPAFCEEKLPANLTDQDRMQLEGQDRTRLITIADVKGASNPADVAALIEAVSGDPLPVQADALSGAWKCRVIELGGTAAIVLSKWGTCTFSKDATQTNFESINGKSALSGTLYPRDDTRMVFLGAAYKPGTSPKKYGADGDANRAGYLFRRGENRLTLEFAKSGSNSHMTVFVLQK